LKNTESINARHCINPSKMKNIACKKIQNYFKKISFELKTPNTGHVSPIRGFGIYIASYLVKKVLKGVSR